MLAETRKAWLGALASGLAAVVAVASGMDFTGLDANTIRDLVLTFVGAALAAGGVTYIVPNRK